MTVIFYDPLTSQSDIEGKGAVMQFASGLGFGDTNVFDSVLGYSPGRAGHIELTGCLSAGEKTALQTAGTITVKISKAALSIDNSQAGGAFTQSEGQVDGSNNRHVIQCFPAAGTAAGRMQFGRHSNGTLLIFVGDSTNPDASTAALGTTSVGKSDYVEYKWTWTGNGTTIDVWVDGVKWLVFSPTVDFTDTGTGLFDNFHLGGDVSRGLEVAAGNNIYLKDLVIEDTYFNPEVWATMGMVGDSYADASDALGVPRYDAGFYYEIKRYFWNAYGRLLDITTYAASGDGYSYRYDTASNLWSEVESAIAANHDYLLFLASVNDLQDDGSGATLIYDYEACINNILDRATTDSVAERIFLTSILPWTQAYDNGSATGNAELRKGKTTQANTILSSFRNYKKRTTYLDIFGRLGGFDYNVEYTIGSATGTTDATDFHPSPMGHNAIGVQLGTVMGQALEASSSTSRGIIGSMIGSI